RAAPRRPAIPGVECRCALAPTPFGDRLGSCGCSRVRQNAGGPLSCPRSGERGYGRSLPVMAEGPTANLALGSSLVSRVPSDPDRAEGGGLARPGLPARAPQL